MGKQTLEQITQILLDKNSYPFELRDATHQLVELFANKAYSILELFNEKIQPYLTTTITIYKDTKLTENECSLNIPQKMQLGKPLSSGDKITFGYQLGTKPMITYRLNTQQSWQGWIPQKVLYNDNQASIVWYPMDGVRFDKPFFDDSFFSIKPKRESSWEKIATVAQEVNSIAPSGFIFHTSRCGSTLLAQSLAQIKSNIVLSQAQLIHEALTIEHHQMLSKEKKIKLLKDVIAILGQKRFAEETNLYIKLDAWSIAELPLILEAFLDTPWIFLYRDPIEVLVSQEKKRGLFTLPNQIQGKLFEQIPKTTHFHDYHKAVIAKIFETALLYTKMPKGIFVNYEDMTA